MTTMSEDTKYLIELNSKLCFQLWHLVGENEKPSALSPRLIRPQKRDEKVRLSEQEPRCLMIGLLNQDNYFYSVETPTKQQYIRKGKVTKGMSARSDLTLYTIESDQFRRLANIEFKSNTPTQDNLEWDILKLVSEKDVVGAWFNVLETIDRRTIKYIFEKCRSSFPPRRPDTNVRITIDHPISILFFFCILKNRRAFYKEFVYTPDPALSIVEYAKDFFRLDKGVSR